MTAQVASDSSGLAGQRADGRTTFRGTDPGTAAAAARHRGPAIRRMNIITKKVTSWAAIIAVPTLITGVYGMNVPYPGFDKPWGVVAARAGGHGDRALRGLPG